MLRPRAFGVALAGLFAVAFGARAQQLPAAAPAAVDFTRDIVPIFQKHCVECHGPKRARARLRLHDPALIARGGLSGPVVTPGKSDESLMLVRILGLTGEDLMPLDADPLPESSVALLRAWIDQGAVMPASAATTAATTTDEHWSYVRPVRSAPPDVARGEWPRNAIDRFILARLEREKLSPSPEAARPALLRRLSLDLIGLPPTPEELDAFLADTSTDAYERAVDRLLASPHFGERWARPWLDLARYADTNGHEKDNRRSIWKYRDWVIDALNRDMPFDRFTVEQIAGDMLPEATTSQRIASGFHRNAMTNEEGGVDPDESLYEVLVDRVNTTATVWLGSTLACAQCHNHKYDPFTQKDYFRAARVLRQHCLRHQGGRRRHALRRSAARSRDAGAGAGAQGDRIRDRAPRKRDQDADAGAARGAGALGAGDPAGGNAMDAADRRVSRGHQRRHAHAASRRIGAGVRREPGADDVHGDRRDTGRRHHRPAARGDAARVAAEGRPGARRLRALPHHRAPARGRRRRQATRQRPIRIRSVKVDDAAGSFKAEELIAPAAAVRRPGSGWSINAMRETARVPRRAVLVPEQPVAGGSRLTLVIDQLDGTIGQGLGRFRVAATTALDPLAAAEVPARMRAIVLTPTASRSKADADELASYYRSTTTALKPTRDAIAAARQRLAALKIPSTLVMKERPTFERPSYELRERGAFTARGPRVYAGTPGVLHTMGDELPANRLGLARWLVDEKNPLVARVAVNRLWEQIFGRGLVETSEDFGAQGACRRIPSCSTGSRRSSWRGSGARRRCCGRS